MTYFCRSTKKDGTLVMKMGETTYAVGTYQPNLDVHITSQ